MNRFLFSLGSLFVLAFVLPLHVSAQGMMRNFDSPTPNTLTQSQTSQDELAGKAVWDKLQNQQITCSELKDDDFDVLGDFFMGNMLGADHDSMNQQMTQRLGNDGEKQMHIAMGKRLSGCDTNAAFPQGGTYFTPMMGFSGGMMRNTNNGSWSASNMMRSSLGIFHLITWLAAMTFLISGSIFFLKQLLKSSKK